MNPMRLGKAPATLGHGFLEDICAVVILRAYRAVGAPQKSSYITSKIEHRLTPPIGIIELSVEVSEAAEIA